LTKKDLSAFQEIAHLMKEKFYTWIDGLNKEVLFSLIDDYYPAQTIT
jgi:hypothetical protein